MLEQKKIDKHQVDLIDNMQRCGPDITVLLSGVGQSCNGQTCNDQSGNDQSGNGTDKSPHPLEKYFNLKIAWIQL